MVHGKSLRLPLSFLPLVAAAAFAQDALTEEELPEIRRYTVEMIIFTYEENVATVSEIFVPDEPPPIDPLLNSELLNGELIQALTSESEVVEPEPEPDNGLEDTLEDDERQYELVMLAEDEFTLFDAFEQLENLDTYTPLLHFGWTQPTYPKEDTEARPLSSFVTAPEGLAGDLKLYLSRYLHLAINLQLDAPVEETEREIAFGDSFFAPTSGEEVISYPVRYRIAEDRIFRNGELRYFDHPKFGILAKILRVEKDSGEEELLGESDFLGFDGE
jgi:hypothetical protein